MNAVIYSRVSSTGDRQSTNRQVMDLSHYAQQNGMTISKIFKEHVSGAKKNSERPVLCDCLDYCQKKHVDLLLISELSRLGRNVWEVQENVKFCIDNRINIYFQKEQLSLFDSNGNDNPFLAIFISVLGTCASMERENIKFRLNSGRKRYIDNGGKLGRKEGSVKTKEQMSVEYAKVIKELRHKTPVRRTAKLCDVSVSTVMRIKALFEL